MHVCIYIALQDMPLTAIAILEAEVEARMRRFAALVSLFARSLIDKAPGCRLNATDELQVNPVST